MYSDTIFDHITNLTLQRNSSIDRNYIHSLVIILIKKNTLHQCNECLPSKWSTGTPWRIKL